MKKIRAFIDRKLLWESSRRNFYRWYQILNTFHRWPIRVSDSNEIYKVTVNEEETIYLGHRERITRYKGGIGKKCHSLLNSYEIKNLPYKSGDIIIDCGANVGEIGIALQKYKVEYHAFEPSGAEFLANKMNNPNGKINNLGLWNESKELVFYNKNDTGDSSFFETEGYSSTTRIKTTTIDEYVEANGLKRIMLLKLEAEGAEPEILEGANNTLNRIQYITVDCGPERGPLCKSTLPEVANHLIPLGFSIKSFNTKRLAALFENQELKISDQELHNSGSAST